MPVTLQPAALRDGIEESPVGHTDFMVFRLKDRMCRVYLCQHAPLAQDFQPIADVQEFARIQPGCDIPD